MSASGLFFFYKRTMKPNSLQAGEFGGSFSLLVSGDFKYLIVAVSEYGRDEMR